MICHGLEEGYVPTGGCIPPDSNAQPMSWVLRTSLCMDDPVRGIINEQLLSGLENRAIANCQVSGLSGEQETEAEVGGN